jgi:hypothetical protein
MRTMLLLILLAVGVAGCGAEGGDEAAQPQPEGDGLVLKVETVPAGPPPHRVPAQVSVALYADGRVLLPAPQIMIYPGPALPGFTEARLSEDELDRVMARLEQAGVLSAQTGVGEGQDVPVRVVTAVTDGERRSIRVAEGSREAAALDRVLADLPFGSDRPYEPQGLAIFASSAGEPVETTKDREIRPEPVLADWPGNPLQPGCAVVTADALDTVLAAAGRAHELTFWRSEGAIYRVLFRPLVPGETSCADIAS